MGELEPNEVELRRAARERALELLYEAEIKARPLDELLAALPVEPAALTVELVRGVEQHRERIDEVLARRVAPKWSLRRLAAVDRAILRLGVYELFEEADRSQAVIINEAVVLARRFGTDDSPRFVNGVLSAVAEEVRPGTEADDPLAPQDTADDPVRASVSDVGPSKAGARTRVDAVVVDLDGVIRHWNGEALRTIDREQGLPEGTAHRAVFEPVLLDKAMRGELDFDAWAQQIGAALAAAHDGVDATAVALAFGQVGWRIDESVLDLLDEVRRQVPVALLSNASSRLEPDLKLSGIYDRFDAVLGSAELGICKPDRGAYRAAADRLGVTLDRCLFVDDTPENVEGARAVGMHAVRYTGIDDLADHLTTLGLVAPRP